MSEHSERYLEAALDELYHGGPEPDLPERILRDGRPPALTLVPPEPRPRRRWPWLQAACAVLALGAIGLLLLPRDDKLPDSIASSDSGFALRGDGIELTEGWYLLDTGSPVVKSGDSRVEQVVGRVLVKVGEIPDEPELSARAEWLKQNGVEREMLNGNWIKAGGLAVCLLFGSAVVDGQPLQAQEAERKRVEELERELEQARQDLERAEREAREREGGEEHAWNPEEAEKDLRRLKEELEKVKGAIGAREKELKAADKEGNEERVADVQRELDELRDHAGNIERHITDIKRTFEIQKLEKRVGEEEGAIEELRGKLEKQPDNEELRKKLKAHEQEAEALRKKLEGLHREFEKRPREEGDPAQELERMIERLQGELAKLREHPDRNAEAIKDHERSIKALEEAVANLRKGDREADPKNDLKEAEGHLKELKGAIEKLLKEKSSALEKGKEDAARALEKAIEEHEVEIRRVRDHIEELKRKLEEHKGEKKDR
jgi:predicted  nucleic acid-binding Zn-ribbon protein